MNIFQQRQFERFERATQFVDSHSKDFAPNSQVIVLNNDLKSTLISVQHEAEVKPKEAPKPKASASAKKAALNDLREALVRIALTAKALEKRDTEFKNTFALPDKRLKNELVSAAQQFQKDALPIKARFTSFELESDFLDTLSAKLEAYQASQAPQTEKRAKGAKNKSAEVSTPFTQAADLMEVLDIVVKNRYHGNAAQLAAWQNATRLNTPPRRRKGEEAEPEAKPAKKTRASKA